jgi:hypothetical protein
MIAITVIFSNIIQVVSLLLFLHPLHISVTEIEYAEDEKMLKIMMRVFTDDLETTLRSHLNDPELDILAPRNGRTADQMVEEYLKNHFKVSLDNKPQVVKYLGLERESDAFILYIEVSKVKKWKTIRVQNSIITEVFDDQSNLVHVTVNDDVKSLRLTRNTPADNLSFDIK